MAWESLTVFREMSMRPAWPSRQLVTSNDEGFLYRPRRGVFQRSAGWLRTCTTGRQKINGKPRASEVGRSDRRRTKATQLLHDRGQSHWLDNITRDLLDSGTLQRYITELSITGLTSNPTIFDQAIKKGGAYDAAIRKNLI
jgi:hypothetical protein